MIQGTGGDILVHDPVIGADVTVSALVLSPMTGTRIVQGRGTDVALTIGGLVRSRGTSAALMIEGLVQDQRTGAALMIGGLVQGLVVVAGRRLALSHLTGDLVQSH